MPFLRACAGLPLVALCVACTTEQVTPNNDLPDAPTEITVNATVDPSVVRSTVPPHGFGMHTSVYDNYLHAAVVPGLLNDAGVTLLRYPGGGYSDNYHWSTHTLVPSYGGSKAGYLAARSDFGSYVSLLDAFRGTAMITVNYGSNLSATGPGEPKEAAAWVAYANGAVGDATGIGLDSTGMDWHSVDYWASLRSSAPLDPDDGQNFLRISHPAPLGIRYWEIGNELFGNGYYTDGTGFEEDLHAPYTGASRRGDARLGPTAYGNGVKAYVSAMKAVDATIQIGAVLDTPSIDVTDWNPNVLAACGQDIDFAIVHWYSSNSLENLLQAPVREVPHIFSGLDALFAAVGPRSAPIQVAVTEMGPGSGLRISSQQGQVEGLFASNGYLALLEHGAFNMDWLELHDGAGTFLSSNNSQRKGPAYKGILLAHQLASVGDALLATTTDSTALAVHASARSDGSVGVMLINTTPTSNATVTVDIGGGMSFSSAQRYDYAPSSGAVDGSVVGPTAVSDVALPLSVRVPPYGEVVLILAP